MDKILEDIISKRPQELCKMCGKCCLCATAPKPYEELKILAQAGDKDAKDFLEIFEPYETIEDALKAEREVVENIINHCFQGKNELTFYRCKHIRDDNLCGNYENRPDVCKITPLKPWLVMPPNCGFNGWLLERREERKQFIQEKKEELTKYENMLNGTQDPAMQKQILEIIGILKELIQRFDKYGGQDW